MMADLENPVGIDLDDDRSIAVRRKRRSSVLSTTSSPVKPKSSVPRTHGISTPPTTPRHSKKRVRFSDPGAADENEFTSSGLTPFIRRTSLASTPSKRRHSSPSKLSNRSQYDEPLSGTLQFAPLRQVLDGRVKRRIKRNRLSEEVNSIEWDKRHEAKGRRREIERLRQELAHKDAEMQGMRDEHDLASQLEGESGYNVTMASRLSSRVDELEQHISDLKSELTQKEDSSKWGEHDWTMAAHDPFDNDDDEDEYMTTNYDDEFTMMDEVMTTPTRLNTSFPSPPSSTPNTPCMPVASLSMGVQPALPVEDTEKEALREQLLTLQSEIFELNASVAFKDDNHARLQEKLADFVPLDQSLDHSTLDSALDTVLTQLALSQSQALDRSAAFVALTSEISTLGFSSSGPEDILSKIATQFRQARLELEYLTPGENSEGFENEKLLEMLVSRVRVLLTKVKERDESIDQYHDQETLLRQQINTGVDVMKDYEEELHLAQTTIGELRTEISEKDLSNEKLQTALKGYRMEVTSLEQLIQRIEADHKEKTTSLEEQIQDELLSHDITRSDNEGKNILLAELERRLTAAIKASLEIQEGITCKEEKITSHESTISSLQASMSTREREHGQALASRDSRIMSLRNELDSANAALKEAHATILDLQLENRNLDSQVQSEKSRSMLIVQNMREQLSRVLDTSMGYLSGEAAMPSSSEPLETPARKGGMFDEELVRRASSAKSKRRKYDSGLGFLEEVDGEDAIEA